MTSQPEPLDVGPIAGGNQPAQEADKSQVASLLRAAAAEGRLTQTELDERLTAIRNATTFDDLIPLTRDLVPLSRSAVNAAVSPEPTLGLWVFGGTTLAPTTTVAPAYSLVAICGGGSLDLTRAQFVEGVCEVSVFCLYGGMTIVVPPGVHVQNRAIAIFGGVGLHDLAPALQGAPTVIVRGLVAFGGVGVQHPK